MKLLAEELIEINIKELEELKLIQECTATIKEELRGSNTSHTFSVETEKEQRLITKYFKFQGFDICEYGEYNGFTCATDHYVKVAFKGFL